MNIMITNNQLAERFEIAHDGSMAILEYLIKNGQMTLVHTEVPEELGGKGFARKLVKFAFDHAKRNNLELSHIVSSPKVISAVTSNYSPKVIS